MTCRSIGLTFVSNIGEGKSPPEDDYKDGDVPNPPYEHGLKTVDPNALLSPKDDADYVFPFDAYPYFKHPTLLDTPRQKDGYILISAGADRIYGTRDDITSFGAVVE
jgi:hypothetical protein